MLRRVLISGFIAVSMALAGGTAGALPSAEAAQNRPPAAHATETRQFRGEGSSDFGLSLYYARADARQQAERAGFFNCVEIDKWEWPYSAWVIWECTR
jgi:hypothetical protein